MLMCMTHLICLHITYMYDFIICIVLTVFSGVWAHGDFCAISSQTSGIVMLGRRYAH